MKKFLSAAILTSGLFGYASACQAQPPSRVPLPPIESIEPDDEEGALPTNLNMYKGKIYQNGKMFGTIEFMIDGDKHTIVQGMVSDKYAVKTNIDEKGRIGAFPLYDPRRSSLDQEFPKATLKFDAKGKPGQGVRKLTGTITTDTGHKFEFEAPYFEIPELPERGRP